MAARSPLALQPWRGFAGHGARFTRFCAVGVANTAIDFAVFWALFHFVGSPLLVANSSAVAVAALNSYLVNKRWTFGDPSGGTEAVCAGIRFIFLNLVGLVIANAVIWGLSFIWPILLAKAVSVAVTMIWNYWSSLRFVYRGATL